MSTRKGIRGRGRGRGSARAGSSASGHMPDIEAREAPTSPVAETGSFDLAARDDILFQVKLHILERVAGTAGSSTIAGGRGSVTERLGSNGAEIFRGVSRVAPSVAEYWLEAIKRILDDLGCTPEQKLKGVVSLLRDESYQWWLTVKEGTFSDRLTWEFFKSTFQENYVGASYVDARRKEFLNLVQGDRSVADLRVLIALQRKQDFIALVEKAKIAEEVKRVESQNWEKERRRDKRDLEPFNSDRRPKRNARIEGLVRIRAPVAVTGSQPCAGCESYNQGDCRKRNGTSFKCGLVEQFVRDCPQRPWWM
ncbi:uncharacterized protein LOC108455121 [Gossypium arboreum]|uniref:uncharacterized protein LOC108455121 n=1 Tax=Gossypium arboreum TaxID=29729 RepID=UPI0008192AB0|nr:uncharacterized protein LOC108455121 [Gossypium arboreum]